MLNALPAAVSTDIKENSVKVPFHVLMSSVTNQQESAAIPWNKTESPAMMATRFLEMVVVPTVLQNLDINVLESCAQVSLVCCVLFSSGVCKDSIHCSQSFADIDECTAGTHRCVPPAECENRTPSYRCTCPAGQKCQIPKGGEAMFFFNAYHAGLYSGHHGFWWVEWTRAFVQWWNEQPMNLERKVHTCEQRVHVSEVQMSKKILQLQQTNVVWK